jgi:predicted alpha/beta hydrolase
LKERDIRKALKARVESYGGEIRAVSWLGRSHAPDVLCLFHERSKYATLHVWGDREALHPFVETKAPKKGPTRGQTAEHGRMRAAGCQVLVINTMEQLDAWLPPL